MNLSQEEYEKLLEIAIENTIEAMNEYHSNYCSGSHTLERHRQGYCEYRKDVKFINELIKRETKEQ